jgi:glycerophosphoryl diester phosphodiesterase
MEPTPARRPLVLGHRGASAVEHENTLAAFRAADEAGADGVELDVRLTSDDVMVIHHDRHVPGFGAIWSHPFEQLREQRPTVPTLSEAFAACGSMLVNIEIKNDPSENGFDPSHRAAELVADWVNERNVADRVLVSSFNPDTVGVVKVRSSAIPTGQLVARGSVISDWIGSVVDEGHEWILPHRRYLKRGPDVVEAAHAAGLLVGVWTVDGQKWLSQFAQDGVDAVITNDPAAALDLYSA